MKNKIKKKKYVIPKRSDTIQPLRNEINLMNGLVCIDGHTINVWLFIENGKKTKTKQKKIKKNLPKNSILTY